MKNWLKLLGLATISGFFILLPVLITYLLLGQLFDLLMSLTAPISDLLPASSFSDPWAHRFAAAAVLLALCILVGLAATTGPARRLGRWFERALLDRFPPYTVVKNLSRTIAGKDATGQLQPALLTVAPDIRVVVAIVEELPEGQLTVFLPLAPTPGMGILQIVSSARVQKLESSMTDALGWVLNWGVGTEALLKPRKTPGKGSGSV